LLKSRMTPYPKPDFPPADFVAFLAQRSGLSEEAAEHRLENWLDEYFAATSRRAPSSHSANTSLSMSI